MSPLFYPTIVFQGTSFLGWCWFSSSVFGFSAILMETSFFLYRIGIILIVSYSNWLGRCFYNSRKIDFRDDFGDLRRICSDFGDFQGKLASISGLDYPSNCNKQKGAYNVGKKQMTGVFFYISIAMVQELIADGFSKFYSSKTPKQFWLFFFYFNYYSLKHFQVLSEIKMCTWY